MAVQNFLAGGYIGKLGNTIGQRWKNKLTVKSYAVPANPRTAKQMANRDLFKKAVELSQEAMVENRGDPSWKFPDLTEFMKRVSVSKLRLQAGMNDHDATPFFPEGTASIIMLDGLSITHNSALDTWVFSFVSPILNSDRVFAYELYYWQSANGHYETLQGSGIGHKGQNLSFSIPYDESMLFIADSYLEIETIDTTIHPNNQIFFPRQPIDSIIPQTINLGLYDGGFYASLQANQIVFRALAVSLPVPVQIIGTAHYRNITGNSWGDEPITFNLSPAGQLEAIFPVSDAHSMNYPGTYIHLPDYAENFGDLTVIANDVSFLGPWGQGQSFLAQGVTASVNRSNNTFVITCTGPVLPEERRFEITMRVYDYVGGGWVDYDIASNCPADAPPSMSFPLDTGEIFPTGASFSFQTSDDAQHNGNSVYFPTQNFVENPAFDIPWDDSLMDYYEPDPNEVAIVFWGLPALPVAWSFEWGYWERTFSNPTPRFFWSFDDIGINQLFESEFNFEPYDSIIYPLRLAVRTEQFIEEPGYRLVIPIFDKEF